MVPPRRECPAAAARKPIPAGLAGQQMHRPARPRVHPRVQISHAWRCSLASVLDRRARAGTWPIPNAGLLTPISIAASRKPIARRIRTWPCSTIPALRRACRCSAQAAAVASSASSMICSARMNSCVSMITPEAAAFSRTWPGPRRADDRRGDVGLAQHPGERELRQRQPGFLGDRLQALHRAKHLAAASAGP